MLTLHDTETGSVRLQHGADWVDARRQQGSMDQVAASPPASGSTRYTPPLCALLNSEKWNIGCPLCVTGFYLVGGVGQAALWLNEGPLVLGGTKPRGLGGV